jgi:hypothetical protein
MTDPARASRLWLAIAVATLWVVSVGGEADATLPCSSLAALPDLHVARTQRKTTQRSRPRLRSCFARGLQLIFVALLKGEALPLGRFIPEPWPTMLPPAKQTKATAPKPKHKGKKKKGKNKDVPSASKAAA